MRFDEIWMQPWQLVRLASLAEGSRVSTSKGICIEVGTWQGLSAIPIAQAIAPEVLHVVDHWRGSPDIPKELSDRPNYSIFMANMLESRTDNITVHKQDWRDFAEDFKGQARFVHLDADHTTREVEDQIAFFKPRMVLGGVLCGDDYGWETVQHAVRRSFALEQINVEHNKLWWYLA